MYASVAGFHVGPLQHRLTARLRRLPYDMFAGGPAGRRSCGVSSRRPSSDGVRAVMYKRTLVRLWSGP